MAMKQRTPARRGHADLVRSNAQGVPKPKPDHAALVTPKTLDLACSCGATFRTKFGQADKEGAIKHLRAARRRQLDEWRHGAKRTERREKRARERRMRLAEIPDGGARASKLAKAYGVSVRAARSWLNAAALKGLVKAEFERGVTVWRRA